jgi:predicted DNA-binding transcriptional regulator AlpA
MPVARGCLTLSRRSLLTGLFDKVKLKMKTQQLDLLDKAETCRLFGGTRPIHPATLYRGIRDGRYPRPLKIGPGSSRWLREECEAVLSQMISGRSAQ